MVISSTENKVFHSPEKRKAMQVIRQTNKNPVMSDSRGSVSLEERQQSCDGVFGDLAGCHIGGPHAALIHGLREIC
jgi:hypothetical protein